MAIKNPWDYDQKLNRTKNIGPGAKISLRYHQPGFINPSCHIQNTNFYLVQIDSNNRKTPRIILKSG